SYPQSVAFSSCLGKNGSFENTAEVLQLSYFEVESEYANAKARNKVVTESYVSHPWTHFYYPLS
ncbi:MAG: hypothetical protein AAFU67_09730, partial [Bacteroidota bacterium]